MTELWQIALTIGAPIAAVVAFGIQLHKLRGARLENQRLELEIQALRRSLEESERRIQIATGQEVEKYAERPQFSFRGPCPGPDEGGAPVSSVTAAVGLYAFIAVLVLFVAYLAFDAYRVATWIWSHV